MNGAQGNGYRGVPAIMWVSVAALVGVAVGTLPWTAAPDIESLRPLIVLFVAVMAGPAMLLSG